MKNRFVAKGIEEYKKRISPFARLEFIDLKRKKMGHRRQGKTLQRPSEFQRCKEGITVALDPRGKQFSSEEFAVLLREHESVDFFIGSPGGLSEDLIQSCDLSLSLSMLTFTSEFAKLILIEQIYRALTILNKRPYHR